MTVEKSGDPVVLRGLLDVFGRLDLVGQLTTLAGVARDWTAASGWVVFALDESPGRLALVFAPGEETLIPEEGPKIQLDTLDEALPDGELRTAGWPGILPDECRRDPAPARSWSLMLAGSNGEPVGLVVLCYEVEPGAEEIARVRALAAGAGPALTNGVAVRAIRDLVFKDDTAECYNRRYFDEFFASELARASRFRAPLSLIFFDMDNLKQVNNEHGHAMGSRTLLEVSRRVQGKVRRFDKLFRFGGDEFCIVLPETEWHGALEVAERVRESIAGQPLLVGHANHEGVKMTASFGISSFPLHARTSEELIHRADWAMQRIKGGGKNSIAIAEIAK